MRPAFPVISIPSCDWQRCTSERSFSVAIRNCSAAINAAAPAAEYSPDMINPRLIRLVAVIFAMPAWFSGCVTAPAQPGTEAPIYSPYECCGPYYWQPWYGYYGSYGYSPYFAYPYYYYYAPPYKPRPPQPGPAPVPRPPPHNPGPVPKGQGQGQLPRPSPHQFFDSNPSQPRPPPISGGRRWPTQ